MTKARELSGESLLPPEAAPGVDHQHGHRERLRQRFLQAGGDALGDYELLELILFPALPRRDVKPLAKTLLARFGSFAEVIAAEPDALLAVQGVGESAVVALKAINHAAQRLLRSRVMNRPVLSNWQALIDCCRATMAYEPVEQFRLLYLNKKNVLIADERQQRGTIDHTPVYPREVVKRALELGASALIMVHNHPSGDPAPSKADIEMTRELKSIAEELGIVVHDHLIVAREGNRSFKSMGLL